MHDPGVLQMIETARQAASQIDLLVVQAACESQVLP